MVDDIAHLLAGRGLNLFDDSQLFINCHIDAVVRVGKTDAVTYDVLLASPHTLNLRRCPRSRANAHIQHSASKRRCGPFYRQLVRRIPPTPQRLAGCSRSLGVNEAFARCSGTRKCGVWTVGD